MAIDNHPLAGKRTDVGYKRPPKETQFQPGNKPAPRKKKPPKPLSPIKLLIKLLDEEQRVVIDGKVRWLTKARLLIMVAFQLAEKGNPTLSRALVDFMLKDADSSEVNEPWIQRARKDGTVDTRTISGKPVCLEDWGLS